MSLRVRITVSIVVLLVVATGVIAVTVVSSTRSTLIDQVDETLVGVGAREPFGRRGGPPGSGSSSQTGDDGDADDDPYRAIAEIVLTPEGDVFSARPSGFQDEPEPLPELPPADSADFTRLGDRIVTLSSGDGSVDYRVVAVDGPLNSTFVFAASLADVDATTSDLTRTVVLAGLLVVVAGAAIAWWTVGRALRPVDRMIGTASAIAAGDLSQRVDHSGDRTELGRLAAALDEMLAQLETSFDERQQAEVRLRRFVADASHELRTPVSAIRGYAELYRSGGIDSGEPLDHAMGRIESESIRMGRLVEDLLLLARLDQHQPLEQAPLDLAELAADAVTDLRATDPDRPVTLDVNGPCVIIGDEQRLRQVVANLLGNARQHTPDGTRVHIEVACTADEATITIRDDGLGIAPEHRDRIFERFYRADASRTRATGGSGLGLSIVSAVVASHGGAVEARSEPGHGATFIVRLPVRAPWLSEA